jgi:WD40 repeat protein
MNQMPNTNLNQNTFNNQPVVPITQDQMPAEERKEEEKKEESKKEDDEYNDFFEGEPPKANPPKKPDSLNEENNKIEIKEKEKKINYICNLKLHGHSDDVNCIFETFDKKLISCGKDGFILIWTLDLPEKPIKIKGHENGVGCGIELKEYFIITGGGDSKIKIWDTRIEYNPDPKFNPKPDIILKGHRNAIFALCKINEKKLASASCDKSIRIWDLDYKVCVQILEGHSGFIWSLVNVVKQDKDLNNKSKIENNLDKKEEIKNILISASSDKTIRFWDVEENRCN